MSEDTPTLPENSLPEGPTVFHFSLIMAEVIFTCELGAQSRRVQFVSKSDQSQFPRSRLLQLQQLAAKNVINDVKLESNGAIKNVTAEAVYLLGTIDCGWMTEEEFLGANTALVAASEMVATDNSPSPETPVPATPETDNVVQFRQP